MTQFGPSTGCDMGMNGGRQVYRKTQRSRLQKFILDNLPGRMNASRWRGGSSQGKWSASEKEQKERREALGSAQEGRPLSYRYNASFSWHILPRTTCQLKL
jgi:hypothetical protein